MTEPTTDVLDADAILRALVDRDIDFVVIGGFAVAAHGYVRATKDVDVVPAPDRPNLERLHGVLRDLAAVPIDVGEPRPEELPVPFGVDGLATGGNWALQTRHGRIDVMQWLPGIRDFAELRDGALAVDLPGVGCVLFAGYDELVAMKRAAGRPEDRLDLERLRDARP